MAKRKNGTTQSQVAKWVEWAFKTGVAGFGTFSLAMALQLSNAVSKIQINQAETDKHVAIIEASRESSMPRFSAMEVSLQSLRVDLEGIRVKLEDIQKLLDKKFH